MTPLEELARLGVATVHEAQGKTGLVDLPLVQVVPGSRVAGRARTALCGDGDNLMVHAAVAHAEPGDVLVLTMPDPTPVALVGDLLATQALNQGVAAMLVDGAVRDVDELRELGLPIWARHVRAQGGAKEHVGALDTPVLVGGARIALGDVIVLDADGAVVVEADDVDDVVQAAREREARERELRARFAAGERSYDVYDLRRLCGGAAPGVTLGRRSSASVRRAARLRPASLRLGVRCAAGIPSPRRPVSSGPPHPPKR